MREGNYAISGQNRKMVPVPNRGGTGTNDTKEKWYWYRCGTNAVLTYRTGMVPVPIIVVPVPIIVVPIPMRYQCGTNLQN